MHKKHDYMEWVPYVPFFINAVCSHDGLPNHHVCKTQDHIGGGDGVMGEA